MVTGYDKYSIKKSARMVTKNRGKRDTRMNNPAPYPEKVCVNIGKKSRRGPEDEEVTP